MSMGHHFRIALKEEKNYQWLTMGPVPLSMKPQHLKIWSRKHQKFGYNSFFCCCGLRLCLCVLVALPPMSQRFEEETKFVAVKSWSKNFFKSGHPASFPPSKMSAEEWSFYSQSAVLITDGRQLQKWRKAQKKRIGRVYSRSSTHHK